jgi:protein-disulfide isomerase
MLHDDERPTAGAERSEAEGAGVAAERAAERAAETADPGIGPEATQVATVPVARPRGLRGIPTGLLVGLLIGILGTMVALSASGRPGSTGSAVPGTTADFTTDGRSAGAADAPITIEIWADYQCPYCGLFTHGIEPSLVRGFAATGQAIIRFRDFAFLGQESLDAAVASRCADRQGRFWEFHDLLYASQSGENQGAFATGNLVKLAEFAGLDTAAFGACLADTTVAGAVMDETSAGRDLGVSSTPTIRIIGAAGTTTFKGLVPLRTIETGITEMAAGRASDSSGDAAASEGPESSATPAP